MRNSQSLSLARFGELLISLYLIWTLLPTVQAYIGYYISNTYAIAFFGIFCLGLLCFLINSGCLIKKTSILGIALLYIFLQIWFLFIGKLESYSYVYNAILCFGVVFILCFSSPYQKSTENLVKLSIVLFCIVLITSMIGLSIYPGASRTITGTNEATAALSLTYRKKNIADINYFQMLILFTPVLYFGVKASRKLRRKIVCFAGIVLIAIGMLMANYTIALLIFGVSLVLSMLLIGNNKKGGIFLLIVIIVCAFIPWDKIFFSLASHMTSGWISNRFNEIALFMSGGGSSGDLGSRFSLYARSFNTFLSHPFGIGPVYKNVIISSTVGIGYHSQLLDDLARYGIFSIAFYIIFIKTYHSFLKSRWEQLGCSNMATVIIITYLGLLISNLGFKTAYEGVMLFLILPGLPVLFSNNGYQQ